MITQLHGFNWETYAERIMPAFMSWLVEDNAEAVQQFYEKTRCAREEALMPPVMKPIQTWVRAQSFIKQLPRSPHASDEYRKLCSAEQYTALSDRYEYRYPPKLYQDDDALRAVWGAIIEEHCLAQLLQTSTDKQNKELNATINLQIKRNNLLKLPRAANHKELAQTVQDVDKPLESPEEENDEQIMALLDEASRRIGPEGIPLGQHPSILHMRGWLASISVRAMALFELLACGRRSMPFGYQACEPFECYIGYLAPSEVWQLALCLRNVPLPIASKVGERYRRSRRQPTTQPETFHMLDEVSPAHADIFLKAVRAAASRGQGLICDVQ